MPSLSGGPEFILQGFNLLTQIDDATRRGSVPTQERGNERINLQLAQARDLLLPRLMNGEVVV